jgi:hypothetical protein
MENKRTGNGKKEKGYKGMNGWMASARISDKAKNALVIENI